MDIQQQKIESIRPSMPFFSLVICTINREKELSRLLSSLSQQDYKNFEIILVDQNKKIDLASMVHRFSENLNILHFKVEFIGLSRARNFGLNHVSGTWIAFPDDDCWYDDKDLLSNIARLIENKKQDIFSIPIKDSDGNLSVLPWQNFSSIINKKNIFTTMCSASFFIKRTLAKLVGSFDEQLGIGSGITGSGEDTDYFLRCLEHTQKAFYFFEDLFINHPQTQKTYSYKTYKKAFAYGVGLSVLIKKHHFGWIISGRTIVRPLAASIIFFYNPKKSFFYFCTFLGRVTGFFIKK